MGYYPRLRDLREDHDMTLEQVAELLGTSYQYYQKYEKGKQDIPLERVIILAKHYHVSIDYIVGLTNDKRGIGYDNNSKYNFNIQGNTNIKIKE